MENRKKRQHYVPQLYLRLFSNDEKHINVFDKVKKNTFSSNILDVAREMYFYDFPEFNKEEIINLQPDITDNQLDAIEKTYLDFGNGQATENRLNLIEDNYAPILKKIIQVDNITEIIEILKENKSEVANFIATQVIRTKRFRNFIKYIENKNCKRKLKKEEAILQTMVLYNKEILSFLVDDFMSKYWVVGINNTDDLLYTSDNPVVWKCNNISDFEFITSLKKSEMIVYPLSDKIILLMYKEKHKGYIKLNKGHIKMFNRLQIKCSSRQIYSKNNNFDIAYKYLK